MSASSAYHIEHRLESNFLMLAAWNGQTFVNQQFCYCTVIRQELLFCLFFFCDFIIKGNYFLKKKTF